MELEEIRNIAKECCIHRGKLFKIELVKTMQAEEGNFDCFGTAVDGQCDQLGCRWREDCFASAGLGEQS